eukprot:CAMPEP_0182852826 /NCGR_PEP_ID=MMETSP0034_2-20130328/377_1 /TAXON_ID=156128 /ORGANISM="Nephroselmis pyriformis, Strain CCMP717" /LENGTH=89 /DNA_ID=CAMNT_0024983565 /DNA_START=51 /DNA_END=317 /DNA_ORIENTATION=-
MAVAEWICQGGPSLSVGAEGRQAGGRSACDPMEQALSPRGLAREGAPRAPRSRLMLALVGALLVAGAMYLNTYGQWASFGGVGVARRAV